MLLNIGYYVYGWQLGYVASSRAGVGSVTAMHAAAAWNQQAGMPQDRWRVTIPACM